MATEVVTMGTKMLKFIQKHFNFGGGPYLVVARVRIIRNVLTSLVIYRVSGAPEAANSWVLITWIYLLSITLATILFSLSYDQKDCPNLTVVTLNPFLPPVYPTTN